jgi:hypothetical protein
VVQEPILLLVAVLVVVPVRSDLQDHLVLKDKVVQAVKVELVELVVLVELV